MAAAENAKVVPKTMYDIPNPKNLALPEMNDKTGYNLLQLADVAERAERYQDVCFYLKVIIAHKADNVSDIQPLSQEERNLLSAAFKNVVGSLRQSARQLKEKVETFRRNLENEGDKDVIAKHQLNIERAEIYADMVKGEVIAKCTEVVDLLVNCSDKELDKAHRRIRIPAKSNSKATNEEAVFYLKMKGDYYRYMAEVDSEKKAKNEAGTLMLFKGLAIESYKKAADIAGELTETSPIRLGLALNHSVCLYEIMKQPKEAVNVAHNAFNHAIQKLDQLNDQTYKDSTLIMQLLRDNLALWQKDDNNGEKPPMQED